MIKFQMDTNGIHNMSEEVEDNGVVDNKVLVKNGQVVNWDDESVLVEMNSEEKAHKENELHDVEDEPVVEEIVHEIIVADNEYGTVDNGTIVAEEQADNASEDIRAVKVQAETDIRVVVEEVEDENEEVRAMEEQAKSESAVAEDQVGAENEEIRALEEQAETEDKEIKDVREQATVEFTAQVERDESENNEIRATKEPAETEIMVAEEQIENANKEIKGVEEIAESDNNGIRVPEELVEFEDNEIKFVEVEAITRSKVSFEQSDAQYGTPEKKHDEIHCSEKLADDSFFCQEGEQANARNHSSSLSDMSKVDEWDIGSSSRRGLDHCITAPVGTHGSSLIGSHDINLPRSRTQKESPFDRLSEREKKKLIVNIVKIQKDGTVEVDLTKNPPVASELLGHAVERAATSFDDCTPEVKRSIPRLKIAMLVVGTRGDVQPFLAMAKRLQEFGHHVRLATHTNFREFVKSAGVEFYPLGGDPRVLAGYMARNKGFIPSGPGEISTQRKQMKQIIKSLLPACTEPDMETGAPFKAQAIIANPPAYGHAHVAEALGVPIHIFFTMPWTPTYEFPHPLARVPQSAGNWISYKVVDLLIWWGIKSYINDFRKRNLKLAPIAYFSMYSGSISHLPTGYMWSPHVVPKPNDWGSLVDVIGYCFLNLGAKYEPREEFVKWIAKGSKPIYIGFGSMPLEDPKKTTSIIMEALRDTGQRGILDRGWGDLGIFSEISDNIFLLDNCPHDWLFPQCSAVVHHGGAGTTATGLKAGCPTTVVPFFGDQFFWGNMIHRKGLGPEPIPIAQLNVESLSNAIKFMLQPEVTSRAMEIAKLIENEDGVASAVDAFHRHLPPELPLPAPTNLDEIDHPTAVQRLFSQIGRLYCLPCS